MSENFDLQYLTLDGGTQPRAEIDAALVEEYAAAWREGAEFPPVVAVYDGTHYWLADGFHRVHGAKAAGLEQIPAEIRQGSGRQLRKRVCPWPVRISQPRPLASRRCCPQGPRSLTTGLHVHCPLITGTDPWDASRGHVA